MKLLFTLITSLAVLGTASPIVERQVNPDPSQVYIQKVSWVGTGCPPGTASAEIVESGTLLSLGFSKYVAGTGTGMTAADARKNCDVRIVLHYPQGWSYTIATTDFRGYASIPSGCSGQLGAQFWFSGQPDTASSMLPINGPREGNYRLTTSIAHEALVWSTCGVNDVLYNINSQSIVKCTKDAFLGVDTQDTKFQMLFHLEWKKCSK